MIMSKIFMIGSCRHIMYIVGKELNEIQQCKLIVFISCFFICEVIRMCRRRSNLPVYISIQCRNIKF